MVLNLSTLISVRTDPMEIWLGLSFDAMKPWKLRESERQGTCQGWRVILFSDALWEGQIGSKKALRRLQHFGPPMSCKQNHHPCRMSFFGNSKGWWLVVSDFVNSCTHLGWLKPPFLDCFQQKGNEISQPWLTTRRSPVESVESFDTFGAADIISTSANICM